MPDSNAKVAKVMRTFFIDRGVDARIARLAVDRGVSKNEEMRALLEAGLGSSKVKLRRQVAALRESLQSEPDGADDRRKVLRSIYLSPEFDNELRSLAFANRISKSALMRWLIDCNLPAENMDVIGPVGTVMQVMTLPDMSALEPFEFTEPSISLVPRMGTRNYVKTPSEN